MILYLMVIIENKIKVPRAGLKARFASFLADASGAASGTRTRTTVSGQGILSPSCLPIPPLRLTFAGLIFFTAAKVRLFPQTTKHFINYLEINRIISLIIAGY